MTTTAFAPAETATLTDVFAAYGIAYLEVTDEPGNGTEIYGYTADDNFVPLGMDEDDDDCVAGYDWDTYLPLVLDLIYGKVGNYASVQGRLTQQDGGRFFFKGTVTSEFEG